MNTTLVQLYDTTLRDGLQMAGIALSQRDKYLLVQMLHNQLNINHIEIYPFSNPKDRELISMVKQNTPELLDALVAFGSTRNVKNIPQNDPNLLSLSTCGLKKATIFGKSWILHLEAIHASPEENLAMIADSVTYLKEAGLTVIYDAEHFFDGYNENPKYALKTLLAAENAGADYLILCDTNGGCLPSDIKQIGQEILKHTNVPLGIHTHNDSGLAVANSIVFTQLCLDAGRRCQVQGTLNGIGERCGNANLITLIPILNLKLNQKIIQKDNFANLTSLANVTLEIMNLNPSANSPFVGSNAFSHKGGMHIAAVRKNNSLYEHINPKCLGNKRKYLISEMAGRSALLQKMSQFEIPVDKDNPLLAEILKKIKTKESKGYTYEGADASLEILIRSLIADSNRDINFYRQKFFEVDYFRVVIDARNLFNKNAISVFTDANVKTSFFQGDVKRDFHTADSGNGPVSALDNALRKALINFYPALNEIELSDFKVRISNVYDSDHGTASRVRVLVETKDLDGQIWNTVGVHSNIILASFIALVDSFIYKLLKNNVNPVEHQSSVEVPEVKSAIKM
ncbi:(R)-citramalate synthase [Candidatus Lokiarchaeum ossiferum]|uniref:Citramalate synthase n=1 Tax=Candidatus Lokiarchaeum ossiferum TaxID=2951803 RepID=A0ABY6HWJ1_9ARCH|nr:(R)-citramalate synthase [Candidatus Lokiarchaeum sp. B-35]